MTPFDDIPRQAQDSSRLVTYLKARILPKTQNVAFFWLIMCFESGFELHVPKCFVLDTKTAVKTKLGNLKSHSMMLSIGS